jgi:hypothetical protein
MAGRTAGPFAATPGISTSSATSAKTKSHIRSLRLNLIFHFHSIDIFYTYHIFQRKQSIHFANPACPDAVPSRRSAKMMGNGLQPKDTVTCNLRILPF